MQACSVNCSPYLIGQNFIDSSIVISWTALIAILLIKYLQFKSRISWSLSNLVALLRWNLFAYRNLWDWLDNLKDTVEIQIECRLTN